MRAATFNVNGIRAAQRRGFESWLADAHCDVLALQEVRCPVGALPQGVFGDYFVSYAAGDRAGRNGVAVLTREQPAQIRTWDRTATLLAPDGSSPQPLGDLPSGTLARQLRAFAAHGRYLEVDLADQPMTVASLYLPKGDSPTGRDSRSGDGPAAARARYDAKMTFMAGFAHQIRRSRLAAKNAGREFLVMGDFNIAHTELDIKNWRSNRNAAGFLPEEREWLDSIISARTLVDVVRKLHPGEPGPYSWWSWLGQAFNNDAGWRIDYQLASPTLARRAEATHVARAASYEQRVSDHAAVVVDYAER